MGYVKPMLLTDCKNLSDETILKKKQIVKELTRQINEEEKAIDFKPCPFCGRAVERIVDRGLRQNNIYEIVVKHDTNCPLKNLDLVIHSPQSELRFWWNKRVR